MDNYQDLKVSKFNENINNLKTKRWWARQDLNL